MSKNVKVVKRKPAVKKSITAGGKPVRKVKPVKILPKNGNQFIGVEAVALELLASKSKLIRNALAELKSVRNPDSYTGLGSTILNDYIRGKEGLPGKPMKVYSLILHRLWKLLHQTSIKTYDLPFTVLQLQFLDMILGRASAGKALKLTADQKAVAAAIGLTVESLLVQKGGKR